MTTRRWLLVVAGLVAIVLIVGRLLATAYADSLWYDSLGASALWRARVSATAALRVGSALAGTLFAFANLYAVRQSVISLVFPRRLGNLEIGEEVPGRYLMGAAIAVSLVLGALLAMPRSDWTTLALARSGAKFGEADPYFSEDLGFFVYWLPLENALWTWAFYTVLVVSVAVILLYALTPSLKWQRAGLYASTYVRRHFTVLAGFVLLMLAWGFRLDMYSLVIDGGGIDGAFSFVDHRVGVTGDLILALTTLGAALIVVWAGFAGQFRLSGIAMFSVLALSLIVREVAPAIAERVGTDAERAARERPYLATRATYTRRAFAVDLVQRADSSTAYASLSAAMPWVPVWDPPALSRAIDAGRSGDDQRVRIAWRWTPTGMVGDVVEPPPSGASVRAPWTLVRVLAGDADDRGYPERLPGPNTSSTDDSPLDAPLVYPGASTIAVISDSLNHTAGIPLASSWTRLANAWALQAFGLLSNDPAQPRPTLIAHRDIRDRVTRLMPFFAQGRNVQPLLVGDSLYWGLDLYAVSSTYPLSRHIAMDGDERSYVRHAAVAIVAGATGDISVVPDSGLDPIAATWVHRLPSIFGTWNALPAALRTQLSPPVDGIYATAAAFGRYGGRTDADPPRHIPILDGADTLLSTSDIPIILPGAQSTAISLPLVDDTDRLRGLFIGTGGANRLTVWYPLPAPGPRWSAVIDRLRSVDSAGSAAREGPLAHGHIRAVPVRSGIGFIQPSYRWRPESIPTLNRIALFANDTARSLAPGAAPTATPEPRTPAAWASPSAAALYRAMRDALRRGDWVAFGRAFDALGRALAPQGKP